MGRGHGDGLEYINDLKQMRREERDREDSYTPKKTIVGAFGIKDGEHKIVMLWIVGDRKDRRHGSIDKPTKFSRHSKEALKTMFKGW